MNLSLVTRPSTLPLDFTRGGELVEPLRAVSLSNGHLSLSFSNLLFAPSPQYRIEPHQVRNLCEAKQDKHLLRLIEGALGIQHA
jgi:hypothetical protein